MERFWRKHGRQVAWRVNGARWLGFVAPAVAAESFVAGCVLLIVRRNGWDTIPVLGGSFVALVLIAWIGWRRARRNWFTAHDGLVRLDARLGLHNRLTSAAAGVGEWPSPSAVAVDDGFRWRLPRLAAPVALAILFPVAAMMLPIRREIPAAPPRLEQPLAWEQVEAALEELKEEPLAEPEAIAALEQKLDALSGQPEQSWYSQSSLEAGDALRRETGNAISKLERNLESAAQALESPSLQSLEPGEADALWKDALKGLESGTLPLDKSQLARLQKLNARTLRQFSPEQLRQLKDELKQKAAAAQAALGKVGDALAQNGLEKGNGGREGRGGPGPGGGHEPLGLKPAPTSLSPDNPQPLASEDLERAALGDVLATSTGEHEPEKGRGPAAGGAVASPGSGGEAVWKNELLPAEQEILRSYFK